MAEKALNIRDHSGDTLSLFSMHAHHGIARTSGGRAVQLQEPDVRAVRAWAGAVLGRPEPPELGPFDDPKSIPVIGLVTCGCPCSYYQCEEPPRFTLTARKSAGAAIDNQEAYCLAHLGYGVEAMSHL